MTNPGNMTPIKKKPAKNQGVNAGIMPKTSAPEKVRKSTASANKKGLACPTKYM